MDSAVLFPEYISRTVRQGMEEQDILPAITATTTVIDSMDYRSIYSEAEDADRVLVMDHGELVMDGTPKEVFSQPEKLWSMGLTVPETVALLYRLRLEGMDLPLTAIHTEECADAIFSALGQDIKKG